MSPTAFLLFLLSVCLFLPAVNAHPGAGRPGRGERNRRRGDKGRQPLQGGTP